MLIPNWFRKLGAKETWDYELQQFPAKGSCANCGTKEGVGKYMVTHTENGETNTYGQILCKKCLNEYEHPKPYLEIGNGFLSKDALSSKQSAETVAEPALYDINGQPVSVKDLVSMTGDNDKVSMIVRITDLRRLGEGRFQVTATEPRSGREYVYVVDSLTGKTADPMNLNSTTTMLKLGSVKSSVDWKEAAKLLQPIEGTVK